MEKIDDMQEQMSSVNTDRNSKDQKERLEVKTQTEMKNTVNGLISRLNTAKRNDPRNLKIHQ